MNGETSDPMTSRQRTRSEGGRYVEEPDLPERDAQAAEMRKRGLSVAQIAKELGIPRPTVYDMLARAYAAVRREPAEQAIQVEVERLDQILADLYDDEQNIRRLMEGDHVTVSQGRVVYDEDGAPVRDDAFLLQCHDRIDRIQRRRLDVQARRAGLLGLNQPAKTEVTGTLTYEIIGLDGAS